MSWLLLVFAGLLEVVWAIGLKFTNGFTKPVPSIITLVAMAASFYFLSVALRTLPLSVAYSVWVGIGMLGSIIVGFVYFKEPLSSLKLLSLLLIVIGIIGLKLSSQG
ncbi:MULTISPECIES: multidrug efflux SMR transporter [Pseudoalteromonas]|uniref:Guanidinium exporter n=1 Tax=Pseudoalteromonas maricaloris TaxID=184924 RepID=A0A8I2H4G3_9GAMM|nr:MULTISPECIES: multidrug efflux SMR transporter [Pseudoalteromonas]KID33046.1 molecular chaperone [Pseudoalteromonas flavipulchra NCIMB 2033 = ATCC BAA-314]MBD0781213.1 multidrug efflux SMR transporter [Pseudoalteromonas flavipulchra]MBE0373420.1 quaternary ammonium compound-resistance protein SugE [Pseudoalteromonas flavipulchra NCIMB 2033 = ATCC BAA-314]MBR8841539.1 multidrug efflux SMR transporter [Pseudoalteromonas sp. JC3]MCG7540425.1 multidrug efflux SMR transporter [Pseudoalteromonas 